MSTTNREAKQLAERIDKARKEAGMTMLTLSDTSGIAYATLRRKLRQKPETLNVLEVSNLAKALDASFSIGFAA